MQQSANNLLRVILGSVEITWPIAAILILCLGTAAVSPSLAQENKARQEASEIWMWAGPHVDHPAPGWDQVRRDSGDLWNPDAPWATVASHVKVVGFVSPNIERATDGDLKQAINDLNRRHISLAISTGVIVRSDRCRSKTEAYVDPGALERIFDKVRRNGGEVKYVEMDEPYYWGHRFSGPSACHESAQAIAQAVAESLHLVRKYFPNAQIGDSEVVDKSRPWIDELVGWTDAYQKATGEKLAYINADLTWKKESVENLAPLSEALKARGIPLGVFYNAAAKGDEPWFDPNSIQNSDVGWVLNAERHYTEVEHDAGVHPDHAVFATWVHYPTQMLPEDKPGTFTNLVLAYIRQQKR